MPSLHAQSRFGSGSCFQQSQNGSLKITPQILLGLTKDESMLGWAKDFFRRHKRKIIGLGVVAGGLYSSYKLIEWKVAEWQERERAEYLQQAKKQFHFEKNQGTCKTTLVELMLPLRNRIFEVLNVEEITTALKCNPENKLVLWEELKLQSFTRTLVSLISTCTLFVFLQVQINIIAGYMYLENIECSCADEFDISELVQGIEMDKPISSIEKEYLGSVKFLLTDGIILMIDKLRSIVNDNIASMSLKSKVTHYEISKAVFNIWNQFKADAVGLCKSGNPVTKSPFSMYLLNIEDSRKNTRYLDEEKCQKMIMETFDVIESEDFQAVLSESIQECLQLLMQSIEPYFQYKEDGEFGTATKGNNEATREMKLPLAKIVPIVNAQSNQIFRNGNNFYLDLLFSMDSINAFSANIYESFSCQQEA